MAQMAQPCHRRICLGFQAVVAMCGICGQFLKHLTRMCQWSDILGHSRVHKNRATDGTDGHEALFLQRFPAVPCLWHLWSLRTCRISSAAPSQPSCSHFLHLLVASRSQLNGVGADRLILNQVTRPKSDLMIKRLAKSALQKLGDFETGRKRSLIFCTDDCDNPVDGSQSAQSDLISHLPVIRMSKEIVLRPNQ